MTKLGKAILKKLSKQYEPSMIVAMKFKGYDLAIKTDEKGNSVLLFIGKAMKKELLEVMDMPGAC
jgi:hypothetical protein